MAKDAHQIFTVGDIVGRTSSSAYDDGLDRGESEHDGPIPLELDWSSPAGEAHHEAMMRLDPEDPVRVAHLSIYTGKD